jgi:plastocyanin
LVPRQLSLGAVAALVVAALALLPAAAGAANRRIAISNYQWSEQSVELDLGEHVTWYWVGPDTMHSVTGESANARGLDSDAGIDLPKHEVGDSFQAAFDAPGTYELVCKLHSTVRGTVTVSGTPGDPASEPDPVPRSRVDQRPPRMRQLALARDPVRGRGGQLHFALDERAKVDADYYLLEPGGERRFAGWAKWNAYVGLNEIRFGGRGEHFRAEPGRYVAEIRATDRDANVSEPRELRFEISAG